MDWPMQKAPRMGSIKQTQALVDDVLAELNEGRETIRNMRALLVGIRRGSYGTPSEDVIAAITKALGDGVS